MKSRYLYENKQVETKATYQPSLASVHKTTLNLQNVALKTPFLKSDRYSKEFAANIFLRGKTYSWFDSIKSEELTINCHRFDCSTYQRYCLRKCRKSCPMVALSCKLLQIHGVIYMPVSIPKQKINQVKMFEEKFIQVVLIVDSYDDAS